MDWLTSFRPVKSLEFYQRKALHFLFSAEGKDDLRYLNIPFTELGFFSPMHFISCIPMEMCEPFKSDRLFLASSGELRKGDKVFLLEKETEGVVRSAVFKGRRLGMNNDTEVVLDGHRKTYSTEEVVPYKAYLREHVGTSLEPQSNYVISGGVVLWVEPTWEVGQELYYRPEKRWATILNREANAKGRSIVTIKMDQTNLKREKVTRVLLNELKANSIPLRVPEQIRDSSSTHIDISSSDDSTVSKLEHDSMEEIPPHQSPVVSSSNRQQEMMIPPEVDTNNVEPAIITDQDFTENSIQPKLKDPQENMRVDEPCHKVDASSVQGTSSTKKTNGALPFKSILRKKSKKRDVRPVTEYFPEPLPAMETLTVDSTMHLEPEPQKFKSCNNLDFVISDEDLDQMELVNYTNSLRSSARKLIQRQLAQEAQQRSLKLRPASVNRPHVSEIFTWRYSDKAPTKSSVPSTAENNEPAKSTASMYVTSISSNDLSKNVPPNNYATPRDQTDYSMTNKSMNPNHPMKELTQSRSRLDYNFLPLSSSELVKQQLEVVNRVLQDGKMVSSVDNTPANNYSELTCVSSDSSSHDNDSGRGSFPILSETYQNQTPLKTTAGARRGSYEDASPTRSPVSSDSMGNNTNVTPLNQVTPGKRYAKNRCLMKHNSQINKSTNEHEPEEEYNIPHPFTPGNLQPVAGFGRGIQSSINSSYADATLFALFSCSNIFDKDLLFSKPGQIERGIKKDIRGILREKIVTPLRLNAYCKAENVTHLKEAMLPLSSKMHSSLMDPEEFLYLLFDSALNTESFIEFSNGTKEYMHQLVARPKDRSKSQTVQFMLETSLGISGLQFKSVPQPALFLCMPRCKGRLVYYEAIVPSLHLNITKHLSKGPKQCVCEMAATLECIICHQKNGDMSLDFCDVCKGIADQIHFRLDHSPVLVPKPQQNEMLNLHSIICTRGNRHVAFVKASEHRFAPWLYLDSSAGEFPEVTLLEDFGRWLDSLEKQPGSYREFAKLHPLLKRIMTDSHIYIYSKAHIQDMDDSNFAESLVI